jgi:hypothetical protein
MSLYPNGNSLFINNNPLASDIGISDRTPELAKVPKKEKINNTFPICLINE